MLKPKPGHNSRFILSVTLLLAIFIYFQQILVINLGGSLKIYELLAIGTTIWFISKTDPKIYGRYSFYLFVFFCVSSLIGYFYFYFTDEPYRYYGRFPEAKENIRFNIFLAPIMIYVYCIFTWSCINAITGSRRVYNKKEKIYRYFVISGTAVAIYSLYGMIFVGALGYPDIVPDIVDFRNSQPEDYALRTIGLSTEPGQLAPILSWTVLYAYYAKGIFSTLSRQVILTITSTALLFTFSSSLVAFIISWLLVVLVFEEIKGKINVIAFSMLAIIIIMIIASYFEIFSLLKYFFFEKLKDFLNPASAGVISSGVQRAFTSMLGLEVFKEFPIFGVGAGNSYFYLHAYENSLNFNVDMLTYSTAPQNSHSMVLAEMGIVGYALLITFFISIVKRALHVYFINKDAMIKAHIVGTVSTLGFLFAIYPIYSLHIWFNIAILMNILYFQDKA
jgi:hypothetical protein